MNSDLQQPSPAEPRRDGTTTPHGHAAQGLASTPASRALPGLLDAVLDELAERVADRLASRLRAQTPFPTKAANEPEHDQGVSVKEAARVLGLSERSVHRSVVEGSIPSMKVRGRRVVFLARYLAEHGDEEVARRAREVLRSA